MHTITRTRETRISGGLTLVFNLSSMCLLCPLRTKLKMIFETYLHDDSLMTCVGPSFDAYVINKAQI